MPRSDRKRQLTRERRRELRRTPTIPEQLVWAAVRRGRFGNVKFRRQHSIGPYIVDFCCVERQLVIEIDGAYHDLTVEKDLRRQRYLESRGFKVLRFCNEDVVQDLDAVIRGIANELGVRF